MMAKQNILILIRGISISASFGTFQIAIYFYLYLIL